MEWTIRISNWHPAKQNEWDGRHWSVRSNLKKRDRSIVWGAIKENNIPIATEKRQIELTVGLGYRQRGGDVDSMWKSLLDALVASATLKDDRKEWVEILPVKYERSKDGTKYTILRIVEL